MGPEVLAFLGLPTPSSIAKSVLGVIESAVAADVGSLLGALFGFIAQTTDPVFTSGWWTGSGHELWDQVVVVSGSIMSLALMIAGLEAVVAGTAVPVTRALVALPGAVVKTAALVSVTSLLISGSDQIADYFDGDIIQKSGGIALVIQSAIVSTDVIGMIFAIIIVLAVLALWAELVVRVSILYVMVMTGPLVIAASIHPNLRGSWRKFAELGAGVILAKVIVAIALNVAFSEMDGATSATTFGGGIGVLVAGFATLGLCCFSPFLLFRLIALEVAQLEGVSRRPLQAARTTSQMAYYQRVGLGPFLSRMRGGGSSPGGGGRGGDQGGGSSPTGSDGPRSPRPSGGEPGSSDGKGARSGRGPAPASGASSGRPDRTPARDRGSRNDDSAVRKTNGETTPPTSANRGTSETHASSASERGRASEAPLPGRSAPSASAAPSSVGRNSAGAQTKGGDAPGDRPKPGTHVTSSKAATPASTNVEGACGTTTSPHTSISSLQGAVTNASSGLADRTDNTHSQDQRKGSAGDVHQTGLGASPRVATNVAVPGSSASTTPTEDGRISAVSPSKNDDRTVDDLMPSTHSDTSPLSVASATSTGRPSTEPIRTKTKSARSDASTSTPQASKRSRPRKPEGSELGVHAPTSTLPQRGGPATREQSVEHPQQVNPTRPPTNSVPNPSVAPSRSSESGRPESLRPLSHERQHIVPGSTVPLVLPTTSPDQSGQVDSESVTEEISHE